MKKVMDKQSSDKQPIRMLIGWLAVLVTPPAFYLLAVHLELSVQAALYLGIMTAVIMMWMFSLVEEYIPALLGMFAIIFFGLAPPSVALSGMASPSLLTLIGAFALAGAIGNSGLARRLVLYLLLKLPNRSFFQENVLLLCGLLLSIVSPSGNSRLALLVPLSKEISEAQKLEDRSLAMTSMVVATLGGAMLFSTLLSNSKTSSVAALSMLPAHLQNQFLGAFWLVAGAVPMVILLLTQIISVRIMFGSSRTKSVFSKEKIAAQLDELGKMSYEERVCGSAFVFFLLGSITTALHFVSLPSIAGMTLMMLLLSGVFKKSDFQKTMDWAMIFFILSLDSLMRTMTYLGLDGAMTLYMSDFFSFVDGSVIIYVSAVLITTVVIRLIFPTTAGMLLSFAMLLPVTVAQGYSPWVCVFLTAIFSDIWFFKYQSSVYLSLSSSQLALLYDQAKFMRHNTVMNVARVICVFMAIPVWQWMSLL